MKARFTDEQIIAMIKEQEAGEKTADVCRRHGISSATFYKYKSEYGGMEPRDAKRLCALEDENGQNVWFVGAYLIHCRRAQTQSSSSKL
ncbi:putative transposase [Yoonia sediminilitoris]|uniref:Putative transposase n=1 Tax=Yoonia sediminilitoris TaxID=1286148 RepID=A0A2T6KDG7_9RHOB|nr:putative transposase [Yoonia sediminilitoris]RCW94429.1 putative transposase [Yoonia sediminilitoris]